MSIPTQPEQPWYDDLDLGESPPLTPDELHDIAIRQTYSLPYWLERAAAEAHERRTGQLLAADNARILAQLEADCAGEWPAHDELQDPQVGPIRIDHEALEAWYNGQEDIPY